MSPTLLAAAVLIYLAGMVALRRFRSSLLGYVWLSFGLAAILVLAGQIGHWDEPLGQFQGQALMLMASVVGLRLGTLGSTALVVPDPSGWSILQIGIECSALIEGSVFAGLILFYPRLAPGERLARLLAGLSGTLAVNLVRLSVIVGLVAWIGKPVVPVAHAVVGRLVFFVGIVALYWWMLTLPTLRVVRRDLEVSGRAAL
ncbi:MAG: hypothetical protein AB1449_12115 [Chloroflexota bacterium]